MPTTNEQIQKYITYLKGRAGVWVKASDRLPRLKSGSEVFCETYDGKKMLLHWFDYDYSQKVFKQKCYRWLDSSQTSESTKEQLITFLEGCIVSESDEEAFEDWQNTAENYLQTSARYVWQAACTHKALQMQGKQSAELQDLRRWKEEAIAVTPDWQAIGKAMNVGLGQSIHDKVLSFIQSQSAEITALEEKLKAQRNIFLNVLHFMNFIFSHAEIEDKYFETYSNLHSNLKESIDNQLQQS